MPSSARLKRWMTVVGLSGLASGTLLGIALNQAYRKPVVEDEPWLQRFQTRYKPSAEQMRKIRRVLIVRDRDVLSVFSSLGGSVPAALRREVTNIRRTADERIQAILDRAQREQYRKDSRQAESASSK